MCIGLGLCPGEYRTLKHDCIRVVSKAGTWNEAHTACLSEGAHLASIHSISEMQFVKSLMWGARVGKVLLGRIVAAVFISCTYVQNCNTRFHLYNVQGESITRFACLILSEHVLSTKAELPNVSFDKKKRCFLLSQIIMLIATSRSPLAKIFIYVTNIRKSTSLKKGIFDISLVIGVKTSALELIEG